MARERVRTNDEVAQNGAPTFQLTHYLKSSIWWSIDNCQIKISADQHHMTISRAEAGTNRGEVFIEVDRWPGYGFSLDRGLNYFHNLFEQAKNSELRF